MSALLLLTAEGAPASAQHIFGRRKAAQQHTVDSLQLVISDLREQLLKVTLDEQELEDVMAEEVADEGDTIEYTAEQTDSLLSEWYARRQAETFKNISEYDLDSVKFTSNVPDSVLIDRLARMNSFITLPFNETVKNYMILYSEKYPHKTERLLGLSAHYFPIFEEILDRNGMPLELKYMAVIESALNPVARSRAGAHGMWQFMYRTAGLYGLKINSFVDERLDVEKSAEAACHYMQDAYNIFGDWALAISSYNCGAGNVNKAIRRAGGRKDFWSIYPYLPRETRGYVPAFVGAMYAMTYYREYGLQPEQIDFPAHTDTMEIRRNLHFKQVSEMVGIPMDVLKELNPQYTHDIVPGNEGTYLLRIPLSYTGAFIDAGDSLYRYKADTLMSESVLKNIKGGGDGSSIVYKVRSGDYLGRIAARYHVTVAQLRKWNGLKNNNLRVGQRLVIYTNGYVPKAEPKTTTTASSSAAPKQVDTSGPYTTYTIKSGDSLYLIAKQFPGVSAQDIMDYNGITSSKIRPGMQIKIPTR